MYYAISRLSSIDVKWTGLYDANEPSFRWNHSNPYWQIIAVADGPVHLQAENQRYALRSGETLLLSPWEQHGGWNLGTQQGTFFWAQFSCHPDISLFDSEHLPDLKIIHAEKTELRTATSNHEDLLIIPKRYKSNQHFRLLGAFEQLIAESAHPKGYFRFHQTLLLGEILRLTANDFIEQHDQDPVFPASYMTYRKLVDHLNNFYDKDENKDTLESALNRRYEYLCQVFRRYAGTTIVSYIQQLRIQRAKHLLLHSDNSIGEIGEEVGFRDAFYFSRVFKRLEGMSPQRYRDQSKRPASSHSET